jgi:hypothetical protein
MITLAEILEMNVSTNLCKVRIPLLETAGSRKKVTMWATMMLPPGIQGGYQVNDVVFISFVDNSLNRPVVLGQLYRGAALGTSIDNMGTVGDTLDVATAFNCKDLSADGTVKLPASAQFTKSTGAASSGSVHTFDELWQVVQSLQARINVLEARP